jgi:MFS family permease
VKHVLPVIVLAQFLCTSLWFAGNAVLTESTKSLNPGHHFLAHLTSAVQFGFIAGTLVFAVFTIADRFSPSKVFFWSSILAGLFNLGIGINGIQAGEMLLFRGMTGFFLAGIYPVGMKIASDYYQEGLGKSLGFLVGALVIGTAFPHLLKDMITGFPWRYVVFGTTILAMSGGLMILLFIPDGPYRKRISQLNLSQFLHGFRKPDFRSAAFGYFGHMWEVYTFWAFVPVMLTMYNTFYAGRSLNVSLLSFMIIASGGFACFISGMIAPYFGTRRVAATALSISCLCCIVSPLFLLSGTPLVFIFFLFVWGLTVVADSPLFSTLVANHAPQESRGSSLTIVNCIGFSITILSIQVISRLSATISSQYVYMFLAIGPIIGLIALMTWRPRNENA